MRRAKVRSRREPVERARRARVLLALVCVPYGRVHMCAADSRGSCGPVHAAQLSLAVQVAGEGDPQLLSASYLPAHERDHLLHSPHACTAQVAWVEVGVRIASARLP